MKQISALLSKVGLGWKNLRTSDRFFLLWYNLIPVLNRVSMLGAFGVSLKLIIDAAKGDASPEWVRLALTIMIGCLCFLALMQWVKTLSERTLTIRVGRFVRRMMGEELQRLAGLLGEEKGNAFRNHQVSGQLFFAKTTQGLAAAVDFFATVLLLLVLLAILTFFVPVLGIVIGLTGLVLLAILSFRVRTPVVADPGSIKAARAELSGNARALAAGNGVLDSYVENDFDKIQRNLRLSMKSREGKISVLSALVSAVFFVTMFFVVLKGALSTFDSVYILIIVLAMRLLALTGKTALLRYASVIQSREPLHYFFGILAGTGSFPEMLIEKQGDADIGMEANEEFIETA